jgi:hypothetical protein
MALPRAYSSRRGPNGPWTPNRVVEDFLSSPTETLVTCAKPARLCVVI